MTVDQLLPTPEAAAQAAAAGGAALSLLGSGLYLRDVRRGSTVPHRGSWLVWTVVATVATAAHAADGGRWSLLVLAVQAASTAGVLALAVRRGTGGVTAANLAMLAVAGLGVLGWTTLADPTAASACAAGADATGLLAVAVKAWRDPWSETASTYALAGASGLLATLAVGPPTPALLLFPLYYTVANALTAALLTARRAGRGRPSASERRRVPRPGTAPRLPGPRVPPTADATTLR